MAMQLHVSIVIASGSWTKCALNHLATAVTRVDRCVLKREFYLHNVHNSMGACFW